MWYLFYNCSYIFLLHHDSSFIDPHIFPEIGMEIETDLCVCHKNLRIDGRLF